ncbi:MAG: PDZ domain-containing protein [Oscillospiraceae bacterium]|nr:PDZ domain-containing protein [Oscillospiraceae bacterium]
MKTKIVKSMAAFLALIMLLCTAAFAADVDYGAKLDEALGIYKSYGLYSDDNTDYVRETLIEMFEEDPSLFYDFVNRIYGRDDRYSKFLTPEKYEETYELTNTMVGIGVVISTSDDGYLTVDSVMTGPAKTAGILPGDKLVEVDGMNVEGYLPAEAAAIIRGKEGTTVKLKILRGEEMLELSAKRAQVATSEVTASYVSDEIGYIKFSHFNGINAFIDFMEAYDDFEINGVNTVIIDLRDNPGGQLDCLVNLMDNIVPEKDIPYLMSWQSKPMKINIFQSEGYGWEFNKLVILVNKNTASAAELMAGSLQDLGYAVVVGEQTFGKGKGQMHLETSDGDEAIVTSLELKLPTTGSYDEVGITPDHKVSMKITPYKLPYLAPLKAKSDASKIKTDNVKALEQRLSALGYFYAEPDDTWDKRTVHAINIFCRENNLSPISSICRWDLIQKIDKAARNLEHKLQVEDTQLERAIEIAEEYAKSDKKAQRIDLNLIDFRRG